MSLFDVFKGKCSFIEKVASYFDSSDKPSASSAVQADNTEQKSAASAVAEPVVSSVVEQSVVAKQATPNTKIEQAPSVAPTFSLPEDAVLRRHFLTHLRSEIEADLFPRPADAVLRRHYEQLVMAKLESRLVELS